MARVGEASDAQRRAFGDALRPYLDSDRGAASRLAAAVGGIDRNNLYYWRDGKREPSRTHVFALERALGLPGGALSHLLGYLPVGAWSTEQAIRTDPNLSRTDREVLLTTYRQLSGT